MYLSLWADCILLFERLYAVYFGLVEHESQFPPHEWIRWKMLFFLFWSRAERRPGKKRIRFCRNVRRADGKALCVIWFRLSNTSDIVGRMVRIIILGSNRHRHTQHTQVMPTSTPKNSGQQTASFSFFLSLSSSFLLLGLLFFCIVFTFHLRPLFLHDTAVDSSFSRYFFHLLLVRLEAVKSATANDEFSNQ